MGVEFTEEFNVQESTPAQYNAFIAQLRGRATVPGQLVQGIPVLPEPSNSRFFDVVLRAANDQSVRVRIRRGDLYVIGYRAGGPESSWQEIRNNGLEHLITEPGTQFLSFGATYSDLESTARATRRDIPLGRHALTQAVYNLINPDARNPDHDRARGLIVIAQMISESMRIPPIGRYISINYNNGSPPTLDLVRAENCWGSLCTAVLHYSQSPALGWRLGINDLAVTSLETALPFLALLVITHAHRTSMPQRDFDMETTASLALIPDGRPLVEIFNVRILNIDDENPGDLYGTITATDGLQSYYIYNRDRSDYESIESGDYATLTGPSQTISAADDFIIDFDLKDYDGDPSPDDEISHGKIAWNVFDHTNVYDKVLTDTITGKYGSAALSYVVMSNAAQALVNVYLINGDNEDPADVYGHIYCENSSFGGEIELFRRPSDNYVKIRPSYPIPLLRAALAVPLDARFKVRAALWDHDTLSPDDEIANGTAEFKPEISKSASQFINGSYGKVQVRVTWM